MPEQTQPLLVEAETDGFLILTLHRPERLNALNPDLLHTLKRAVQEADESGDLKGLILRGAGGNFCAGGDIFNMREAVDAHHIHALSPFLAILEETAACLYACHIPTLCVLEGIVAGAGIGLALATDIRIATPDTRCHLAFPTLGAIPDAASSYLLPRIVGYARAMEFYIKNEPLDAKTGLAWGLFHEIRPADELSESLRTWKEKMAQLSASGFRHTKTLFRQALFRDMDTQIQTEYFGQLTAMATEHFAQKIIALTTRRDR